MTEVRIERDPNTEVMPDYDSELMRTLLQDRLKDGETLDQVIQGLKDSWTAEHQERLQQWTAQQVAGGENAEEQRRREEEEQRRLEGQRQREEDEERPPAPPKKPKLKGLAANKPVATVSTPRPSSYALNKLKAFEYVELYYFTPEGCKEASRADRTTSNEAFTPTRLDDQLVLQPLAAHKPSAKVVPDANLTWTQVSLAKTVLIKHMQEAGWPEEHLTALSTLYYELDSHAMRQREHGESAVVQYQATVRRQWHDELKAPGDEEVFDIGLINDTKLERFYTEILQEMQLASNNSS
ncbi:hypothetical protein FA15DRAFT_680595 [Coprinopsis marcescibilis]|uniref:Uncharacterized protein n=1 Tax=Coprinopsis marcescibilis TaxID=230819 RepID=A0A5C3KVP2_COPMA|nr:hypothetical protein FA15DRAFT_680595 [Coprinopsis marcescibilis]